MHKFIHSENLKELLLNILVMSVVPNANGVEKRFEEFRSVLNILAVESKDLQNFLQINHSHLTSETKDLKRYTYSREI